MNRFDGKIAVITGAGTGIGRALAIQLASEGCHIALCDLISETLLETRHTCEKEAPTGTRVSDCICDVGDESQVLRFCRAVQEEHQTGHINLLFNNAGIGGGSSFLQTDREEWERTFGVDWFGVYYCTRAFMPLLVAGSEGHIINTSSINGFWACLGPNRPHSAYSTAKFAVKGFSESLLVDLRENAPHINVSLVMPGHIGTSIITNTNRILGTNPPAEMTAEELARVRDWLVRHEMGTEDTGDDDLRALIQQNMDNFVNDAPLSPEQAATIILDGVRNKQWRILVGEDAQALDRAIRADPETAYDSSFIEELISILAPE